MHNFSESARKQIIYMHAFLGVQRCHKNNRDAYDMNITQQINEGIHHHKWYDIR